MANKFIFVAGLGLAEEGGGGIELDTGEPLLPFPDVASGTIDEGVGAPVVFRFIGNVFDPVLVFPAAS